MRVIGERVSLIRRDRDFDEIGRQLCHIGDFGQFFGTDCEGWAELLATPEEALELRLRRRCTYAGRPFGEKAYVAMFEAEFGRAWRE